MLVLSFGLAPGLIMDNRPEQEKPKYPPARRADVVDDYHGTRGPDPYRWLEEADSEETRAWVEAQNRLTFGAIRGNPQYAAIRARLAELWNYPRYSVPQREGARVFFSKNDGLQNQAILYAQRSRAAEPELVLDPNRLSADGTIALVTQAYSRDGRLRAYGLSASGSDRQEIRVRDVETGRDYPEVLRWCKFATVAWKPDGSGFFYDRFPEPGSVPPEDENNYNRVYWHRLGTAQSADRLVFEHPDKELGFSAQVTEDGRYLLLTVYHGTDPRTRVYYRELEGTGPFVRLLDRGDAMYAPLGNLGTTLYLHTDEGAPRGRVIAIDLRRPERSAWKEVVAEADDVIHFAAMVHDEIVLARMRDAHDRLEVRGLDGRRVREIPLPALGSISGLSGRQKDREMYYGFTSFLQPATSYRYDFGTGASEPFRRSELRFDPSAYVTEQVFYRSKDGTRVPMFLTHRKGIARDGSNPVLLYGYGGFNVNETPVFSVPRLVWLEAGGVFAQPNLRGGNEYGEAWHQAGMLERKQNVFDDFIAAAEWLISAGYTRPERLAIQGGSNGGLLVAACMVQRPELFGAVIASVPVIDMLRYHRFTIGRYWIPEYGNAEADPAQFRYLRAYSPLHNIKPGTAYPATLITSADTDDRVVPAHAKKFAAALQAADAGKNPILLRVETRAGHGLGKPVSKQIEEAADVYAFLFRTFGMTSPSRP
jgi:prolyl oligopeptidase